MSQAVGLLQYSRLNPPTEVRRRWLLITAGTLAVVTAYLPFGDLGGGADSAWLAMGHILSVILSGSSSNLVETLFGTETACINLIAAPLVLYLLARCGFWRLKTWELLFGYGLALICGLAVVCLMVMGVGEFLNNQGALMPVVLGPAGAILIGGIVVWLRLLRLRQEDLGLCALLMTYYAANSCFALGTVVPSWFSDPRQIRPGAVLCGIVGLAYLAQLLAMGLQAMRRQSEAVR